MDLLERCAERIADADLHERRGRVDDLIGVIVEATGLEAEVGEVCTVEGFSVVLNYGLNKVRFPAPLRVGSRIRLRVVVAEVKGIEGPGGTGAEAVYRLTYEVEGQEKPCCVADLVFRYYL